MDYDLQNILALVDGAEGVKIFVAKGKWKICSCQ
jgi:hypothetical protein